MSMRLGQLQRRILRHLAERRGVTGTVQIAVQLHTDIGTTRRALLRLQKRGLVVDAGRYGRWRLNEGVQAKIMPETINS